MAKTERPFAAALWMIGSILSFSAMAVAARALTGLHDTFEIMLWRSLVGFVIVVAVAATVGRLGEVRSDRLGTHAVRNIFHFTGQNLWFYALGLIPLAQVFALEFTSPVWVILLSFLFLAERITWPRALAAGLGFAGILVVARPDVGNLSPGLIAGAAAAIFFAATIIMTKALTGRESLVSILFWLTLMQLCFGLGGAFLDGSMTWPTATTLPWLALIGVCGIVAHACLTQALSLASASVVVPMDFLRLPLIAFVGMLLYGEPLDVFVFIGGAIILFANWFNIRAENRSRRQSAAIAISSE